MLGEFITKGLVLVLGYAYPAFECFKTMEKNKVEKAELQFWCQYWYEEARRRRSCVVSGRISVTWLPRMRRRGNGKCRKMMENRRKRISSSRT
ncbi:unnamed protein product [Camellia sinensis]